ncbi:hypothetical protein V8C86DRAFT_3168044 [Haematococcus lacustris]
MQTVLGSSTRGVRLVFQKLKRRDQCTEPGSSHDSTPSIADEPTGCFAFFARASKRASKSGQAPPSRPIRSSCGSNDTHGGLSPLNSIATLSPPLPGQGSLPTTPFITTPSSSTSSSCISPLEEKCTPTSVPHTINRQSVRCLAFIAPPAPPPQTALQLVASPAPCPSSPLPPHPLSSLSPSSSVPQPNLTQHISAALGQAALVKAVLGQADAPQDSFRYKARDPEPNPAGMSTLSSQGGSPSASARTLWGDMPFNAQQGTCTSSVSDSVASNCELVQPGRKPLMPSIHRLRALTDQLQQQHSSGLDDQLSRSCSSHRSAIRRMNTTQPYQLVRSSGLDMSLAQQPSLQPAAQSLPSTLLLLHKMCLLGESARRLTSRPPSALALHPAQLLSADAMSKDLQAGLGRRQAVSGVRQPLRRTTFSVLESSREWQAEQTSRLAQQVGRGSLEGVAGQPGRGGRTAGGHEPCARPAPGMMEEVLRPSPLKKVGQCVQKLSAEEGWELAVALVPALARETPA